MYKLIDRLLFSLLMIRYKRKTKKEDSQLIYIDPVTQEEKLINFWSNKINQYL